MSFEQIKAIAEKEVKLNLRYKYNYFGSILINPIKWAVLFMFVYSGFFLLTQNSFGSINTQNYIPFLILGSMVHAFFNSATNIFHQKFIHEKYWETISGLLMTKINNLKLILGIGLSEFIRLFVITAVLSLIAFIVLPINFITFLIILVIILIMFFGCLGFGLIKGAFSLSNENYLFLFDIFIAAWIFLSCFYYPIEILPSFLKPLVLINPIYHGLTIIRSLWLGNLSNLTFSFIFLLSFAVLMPLIGILLFNKIQKNMGIHGY